MRRPWALWICVIGWLLSLGGAVSAREFLNSEQCIIEADQIIAGNVFVLCEELHIYGTVRGDIIGAAVRVTIHESGRVRGNVYLAAGQMDIRGMITGDLHFGGVWLRINPPPAEGNLPAATDDRTPDERVRGSLKAVALSTELYRQAEIGEGIILLGYQLLLNGTVEGEISYWGSALLINGNVDDNVYATVGDPASDSSQLETLLLPFQFEIALRNPGLILSEDSTIDGSLVYTGPAEAMLNGIITGDVVYEPVTTVSLTTIEEPGDLTLYFSQLGREFTTLLFIGVIGLVFLPRVVQLPLTNLRVRPFASFSVGMLAFILSFPVILIIIVLTVVVLVVLQVIGLSSLVVAVGILLGMVNIAGMSLFYFVAIYISRALIGLAVGRFLLRMTLGYEREIQMQYIGLALGVLLLAAAVSLPVVGPFINAAALFLGLGTIFNVVMEKFRNLRDSSASPAPAWYAPSPAARRSRTSRTAIQQIPDVQILPVPDDDHDEEAAAPIVPETDDLPPAALAADDDSTEIRSTPPEQPPDRLPPPSDSHRAGMDNLPDGFDFSFFEDDENDEQKHEEKQDDEADSNGEPDD